MANEELKFHIGTSGYFYDHWKSVFYPPKLPKKDWLKYYAEHFNSVELNSPFYKLPKPAIVKNWRESVHDGFRYSIKSSSYITHKMKLSDVADPLQKFYKAISPLKKNLGPLVFQLPPTLHRDTALLKEFLSMLSDKHSHVIEFRHPSWQSEETFSLLSDFNVAYGVVNIPGQPLVLRGTTDFTYMRMLGNESIKKFGYSNEMLKTVAARLAPLMLKIKVFYIYFNNDSGGNAVKDAKAMAKILEIRY